MAGHGTCRVRSQYALHSSRPANNSLCNISAHRAARGFGEQRNGDAVVTSRCVRSLQVRAQVADPAPEVRRARARAVRGDADWQRCLWRYEHGDTLIVALTAFAVIDGDGGSSEALCFCHEVVWIDRPVAPRALHERLREVARRDLRTIGPRLRDRGIQLSGGDEAIAVQLVIDSTLAGSLDSTGSEAG